MKIPWTNSGPRVKQHCPETTHGIQNQDPHQGMFPSINLKPRTSFLALKIVGNGIKLTSWQKNDQNYVFKTRSWEVIIWIVFPYPSPQMSCTSSLSSIWFAYPRFLMPTAQVTRRRVGWNPKMNLHFWFEWTTSFCKRFSLVFCQLQFCRFAKSLERQADRKWTQHVA